MNLVEDRRTIAARIEAAHRKGARLKGACELAGIDVRTLQRWKREGLEHGGGEFRQYPGDVGLRVHPQHLACARYAVNDGRALTGGRMSEEEIVLQADFHRPEAELDWILINEDVSIAHSRA